MGKKFSLADLPETIPIFPLPGALLLPRARLPLNIFEPRYLAMLEDALKTPHRLIGMIQPLPVPEGREERGGAAAPDRLRRAGHGAAGNRGRALPDHPVGRQPLPARASCRTGSRPTCGAGSNGRASSATSGGPRRTRASTGRRSSTVLARFFDSAQLSSDWDSLKEADAGAPGQLAVDPLPVRPGGEAGAAGGADAGRRGARRW